MKKIMIIAMVMLGVAFTSNAQNANRSGFFIELSPGIYVGNTPVVDVETKQTVVGNKYVTQTIEKHLSGLNIEFDAGYRWAFHRHWALDAKVGFSLPTSRTNEFWTIEILPGLRYTSKELGSSNVSLFAGFNAGLGIQVSEENPIFAYELKAGFNLSNRFSIGLVWNALYDLEDYNCNTYHTGALGINLGYRF